MSLVITKEELINDFDQIIYIFRDSTKRIFMHDSLRYRSTPIPFETVSIIFRPINYENSGEDLSNPKNHVDNLNTNLSNDKSVGNNLNKRDYSTPGAVRSFHSSTRRFTINIYDDLKYFSENNLMNNETQIEIERHLLNHGMDVESSNKQIRGIYNPSHGEKTQEFFNKFKPDLIKKINNFIKFKSQFSEENTKKKLINKFKDFVYYIRYSKLVKVCLPKNALYIRNLIIYLWASKNIITFLLLPLRGTWRRVSIYKRRICIFFFCYLFFTK